MNKEMEAALTGIVYGSLMGANGRAIATDDQRIRLSGLYSPWALRDYAVGEICEANSQTWECFQAFTAAAYPQVTPDDPAFLVFFRPLHGRSLETAREFVQPAGAHDMYKAGEYVWFRDRLYLCKADTAYSPVDYESAWEVQ